MQTMKANEIRQLSDEDLTKKLVELRTELIKQNAQIATGTVPKSPGQIKQIKKNIARITSELSKKEKKQ